MTFVQKLQLYIDHNADYNQYTQTIFYPGRLKITSVRLGSAGLVKLDLVIRLGLGKNLKMSRPWIELGPINNVYLNVCKPLVIYS